MEGEERATGKSKTREEEDCNLEEYEEDEDDDDIDKEAQEIARRLGEQLWADITKVNAERNAAAASSLQATATIQESTTSMLTPNQNRRKEDGVITTMQSILALVENDAQAKTMMFSTAVANGPSILELLYQCTSSGNIDKDIARSLSQAIILLVKSEALFGNLRQSNAPAMQLDIGKRKREEFDEGNSVHPHPQKRPYVPESDLHRQVVEAVHVISQALGVSPSQAIDPNLVSSLRLQLHQVFLFAVTSAAAAGPNMYALQEIGGLIQVIGVLSGIQIGHSPSENMPGSSSLPGYTPGHQSHAVTTDIGTAVYPCLIAGCGLIFARLYSLRAHQRSHASHRPHRCGYCPASFARNHDLKRHARLHDRKAWKCQGCHKVFSRRDAIKRHKNGIKSRGAISDLCLTAEVVEVQLEDAEAETAIREERRAKLWNDIAVNEVVSSGHNEGRTVDDGAINPAVVMNIQTSILSLHGLLQTLVGNALGTPVGQSIPVGTLVGQATLASVIARAQSQSSAEIPSFPPQGIPGEPSMVIDAPDGHVETHSMESQGGEHRQDHQPLPSLSMYGLSDEQTRLLELAIANAASAAQAQAEAEAALEEEENGEENDDEEDNDDSEMEQDKPQES